MSPKKKVVDVSDEFDALLEGPESPLEVTYRPIVGYVYEHGPIVRYFPEGSWYNFGRAVSGCWGSLARRTRGTWDAEFNDRGEPIRALLVVQRSNGTIAWKHAIDLREIRESR